MHNGVNQLSAGGSRGCSTETPGHSAENEEGIDLRVLKKSYDKGDKVYILDNSTPKGKCKQLCPPWKGPGIVVERITPYLFREQLHYKVMFLNHDKLKPCRDRQLPTWLRDFTFADPAPSDANTDDDVFYVCKKPWGGQFMIQCDYCGEWFHGVCINIAPSEALDIATFKCAVCKRSAIRH